MDILLEIGDIVVDVASGDVGLLVMRYSLFEDLYERYGQNNEFTVWAWNIYWTGPATTETIVSRYHPYTEEGLYNLIRTGTFVLKKKE